MNFLGREKNKDKNDEAETCLNLVDQSGSQCISNRENKRRVIGMRPERKHVRSSGCSFFDNNGRI